MAATTITRMQVRRPDGTIETVERDGSMGRSPVWCEQARASTKAAGKGEILSFEVIDNPATLIAETDTERLRCQRRDLVATVQGMIDESDAAFEAAHAREDARAWTIKAEADQKVDAARQALAVFDAEYPEIIAEIQAEKQASAERHMWD